MEERWRVEELALRADVSVDTVRFYQKRRVLQPPTHVGRIAWYGAEHLHRLARIRELQGQGLSLAVIGRLVAGELDPSDAPLAAAVAGARAGGESGKLLTLNELASRVGVPTSILDALVREELLVARRRDGEPCFTTRDADVVAGGLRLLEAGLPLADLLALARRHHEATRLVAQDAVEMFDEHVRRPLRLADLGDDERARRLVETFRVLLSTITVLIAHHFERVLLEVAQEHLEAVGDETEIAAARAEPDWGESEQAARR